MSSIIVTGANRGIGFQIAKTLAEQNNTVFATCRDPSKATELKKIKNVHVVALDVASKESVAKGIQEISKLAPDGIDELWNNAGVNQVKGAPMDVDCEALLDQININGVGCSRVTQKALELLEKKKTRRVVFVSSDCGTVSAPAASSDVMAYTTSKVAMSVGAKYWHGHLSPKGYSHPGWVRTDMGGSNATLSPEESINGMLKVVNKRTPQTKFEMVDYSGKIWPW